MSITVFFSDREPAGRYRMVVPAPTRLDARQEANALMSTVAYARMSGAVRLTEPSRSRARRKD